MTDTPAVKEPEERKVISLDGTPVFAPGEADPWVVEALEDMLERAKSGECKGFAIAWLTADQATCHHVVGRVTRAVLGAVTILQHDMIGMLED